MNEILSKLQKGIQKRLASPDSLIWKYDGSDRGGEPFQVFLDMDYHGRAVTVEWRAFWGDSFGISRMEDALWGSGHDFKADGVEAAIAKAVELLETDPPKQT